MEPHWELLMTDRFDSWYEGLADTNRKDVLKSLLVLAVEGPSLKRPYADTVNGSVFKNMKELRVQSKGRPFRIFFAFDPAQKGILLCGGDKGGKEKRFYKVMISLADKEFEMHLLRNGLRD